MSQRISKQGPCISHTKTNTIYPNVPVGQDARIHVSEPDFEALTQGGLLDSSIDGGITIVEFERIMRAQLTLHAQARFEPALSLHTMLSLRRIEIVVDVWYVDGVFF